MDDYPINRRTLLTLGGLGALSLAGGAPLFAAATPKAIKFACVAPEGSLWVNLTREWDRELRERSQQQARIQIFAGGTMGEEGDAIRKMRAGQLHATGVTGIGMGEMVSATRVLELPRMFQSLAELDAAVKGLESYYQQEFDKKGYVLMGFTEVGPIHLFTRKPVKKVAELNSMRMWVWEGDKLSEAMAKTFKVSAVPLSLLNVLSSLQTGVIDGVYGSPLATVTMQWHKYLKYMTLQPLAYAVGVIAMDKKAFLALPPDVQALQRELGRKYTRKMVERAREDNDKAVALMKKSGIEIVAMDGAEVERFNQTAETLWSSLAGTLYSPELLAQLKTIVKSGRAASMLPSPRAP